MYSTIDEIKEAAKEAGSHWFDADTMAFFNTRFESHVMFDHYFVTSEQDDTPDGAWDGERRYTVRYAELEDGHFDIKTIGEFGEHDTLGAAADKIFTTTN